MATRKSPFTTGVTLGAVQAAGLGHCALCGVKPAPSGDALLASSPSQSKAVSCKRSRSRTPTRLFPSRKWGALTNTPFRGLRSNRHRSPSTSSFCLLQTATWGTSLRQFQPLSTVQQKQTRKKFSNHARGRSIFAKIQHFSMGDRTASHEENLPAVDQVLEGARCAPSTRVRMTCEASASILLECPA
jgi:hypothetical protein